MTRCALSPRVSGCQMMGVRKKTSSHMGGKPRNGDKERAKPGTNTRRQTKATGSTDRRQAADNPESMQGSPAERIWQVVALIPKGRVATYGQIARLAGMPRHARLVGRTLRELPAGSRLPWFRVVNAKLAISTRAGGSENLQRQRLEAEGVEFVGERVASAHRWDTATD